MTTPIVAIVGLPNTGKSTFFNKVLNIRKALTHPQEGTTRDRHYGLTTWNGLSFYLVDTAGIINRPDSDLEKNVQKQTEIAIDQADLILLVTDGKTSMSEKDLTVANQINRAKKPVVLAVNKIETRNAKTESTAAAYAKLGLGPPYLMSSLNGSGIGDALDAITLKLKKLFPPQTIEQESRIRLAFVGKPNVGKSSLVNALLKEDRLIVHKLPGTTRSTVDIPFDWQDKKFLLLDTAGIKKKWKQDTDIEAAAAFQSIRVVAATDVALFVVDTAAEITAQDQVIAQEILEQNRPIVIVLNKADLLSEEQQQKMLDKLPHYLPQLWWAPVIFVSAKTGLNLDLIFKFASDVYHKSNYEIEPEKLDEFLQWAMENHMPGKMDDQRAPKIYNLKQIAVNPPTFKMTVNFPAALATAWKKFFEKQFRLKFGLEGTPIVIKYIKR